MERKTVILIVLGFILLVVVGVVLWLVLRPQATTTTTTGTTTTKVGTTTTAPTATTTKSPTTTLTTLAPTTTISPDQPYVLLPIVGFAPELKEGLYKDNAQIFWTDGPTFWKRIDETNGGFKLYLVDNQGSFVFDGADKLGLAVKNQDPKSDQPLILSKGPSTFTFVTGRIIFQDNYFVGINKIGQILTIKHLDTIKDQPTYGQFYVTPNNYVIPKINVGYNPTNGAIIYTHVQCFWKKVPQTGGFQIVLCDKDGKTMPVNTSTSACITTRGGEDVNALLIDPLDTRFNNVFYFEADYLHPVKYTNSIYCLDIDKDIMFTDADPPVRSVIKNSNSLRFTFVPV